MPDQLPEFDISGPSVDDDIRRLIGRYGAEHVQAALKRGTARKLGRRPSGDWLKLGEVLREDARCWLDGGNPFDTRSNYSIAQEFAVKSGEQSEEAAYRRLMGKLSKRRRYYTLVEAAWLSQDQYPYADNLRTIRELVAMPTLGDLWRGFLRLHEGAVADYRTKFGEPAAEMTIRDILAEAARPIIPTSHVGPGNVLQILAGSRRE